MSEEPVYEGRLCTVRRVGKTYSKILSVDPELSTRLYDHDELLSELQLVMAAILGEKA